MAGRTQQSQQFLLQRKDAEIPVMMLQMSCELRICIGDNAINVAQYYWPGGRVRAQRCWRVLEEDDKQRKQAAKKLTQAQTRKRTDRGLKGGSRRKKDARQNPETNE